MFTVSELNPEQLSFKQDEFSHLVGENKRLAWEEMHVFFASNTVQEDRKYWYSFFRWYTFLTFRNFQTMNKEDVVNMVFGREVFMILLLDFDLWTELIWYLNFRATDENSMKNLYSNIRTSFLESSAIAGEWQGKQVTQKELIDEIKMLDRQGNDSIKMAEFYSKLRSILFPKNELQEKYIYSNPDTVVHTFVDLTHFFIGVDPDGIGVIVDSTLHPDKYEKMLNRPKILDSRYVQSAEDTHNEHIISEEESTENSSTNVTTYQNIQQELQTKFTLGADGQFENIEGVIGYLDELATAQQNEKIRDLYVFNENTGMFEWNEQLLSETI